MAHRQEIESDFGGTLIWNRMEEARSCKVVAEVPGAPGWQDDLDECESGLRALAEAMKRFGRAFAPHITAIDPSPPVVPDGEQPMDS